MFELLINIKIDGAFGQLFDIYWYGKINMQYMQCFGFAEDHGDSFKSTPQN